MSHVRVALRRSESPKFVLGAMLPDLVNMIAAHMPEYRDPSVQEGVRLHHRTDTVFHASPTFAHLCQKSREHLIDIGVARGSARAPAHVGLEILLDRAVGESRAVVTAAEAAFTLAERRPGGCLEWPNTATRDRFGRLAGTLLARDLAGQHGTPEVVAWRVGRALAGRTRLELTRAGQDSVARWAEGAMDSVRGAAPALLSEVAGGLRASAMAAE